MTSHHGSFKQRNHVRIVDQRNRCSAPFRSLLPGRFFIGIELINIPTDTLFYKISSSRALQVSDGRMLVFEPLTPVEPVEVDIYIIK